MNKLTIILLASLTGCSSLPSSTSLTWINGETGKPVTHLSRYRVEQPANLKLRANFPANTQSVVFYMDDKPIYQDNQAPFLLEKRAQEYSQTATTAANKIIAKGYTELNGQGELTATAMIKNLNDLTGISLSQRLTSEQTWVWQQQNADNLLVKKIFQARNGMAMPYRIFVPPHYTSRVKYPLLVFLHGRGQRGTDNSAKMFTNVGLFNGPQSIISPNSQQDFPAIVLVPQCSNRSADEEWAHWVGNSPQQPFAGLGKDGSYNQANSASASGEAALELIETTLKTYNIDKTRVYLTGISMGGFGTWEFTTRKPNLFAAAVPMAGYSDYHQADKITGIPFWIFHGDQDEFNPVEGSRNMVSILRKISKAEIRYTELKGLKHNESFVEAWRNPDILPWIFSQQRDD